MPKNQMRHWLFHGKDSDHLIVSGNVLEGVSLFPNIHTMDWLPKKVEYLKLPNLSTYTKINGKKNIASYKELCF